MTTTDTNYSRPLAGPSREDTRSKWAQRRDIPLTILAWTAVVAVVLWSAGHIVRSLLLLIIAALLAYALAPAVKVLRRFMPRFLAILIVYLLVLGTVGLFLYLVTSTALKQTVSLAHDMQKLLAPSSNGQPTEVEQMLGTLGIGRSQIDEARQQIVGQAEGIARDAIPILRGVFDTVLDTIVVGVISIYLLIDGSHFAEWIRRNSPRPARANFILDTLQRVVGGYIRGQVSLAALVGVLVGVGMFILRVPYAEFLGVLAFVMAFVPVIGTFISGAVCVLLALTKGWPLAVGVLIYFIGVHIIEGDVVGPRIVGKAIGIHPVVTLFALIAGAELFGIWGALFASPIAGIIQAFLSDLWINWRKTHPEQFEQIKEQTSHTINKSGGGNAPTKIVEPPEKT